MKDAVDILNHKIEAQQAEIEALKHQRDQAIEAVQQLSAGQTITQVAEGHLIQNMQREIEALKKENAMLKDAALGTPCEQIRHAEEIEALKKENKRYRNALQDIASAGTEPAHLLVKVAWEAIDAAREGDE